MLNKESNINLKYNNILINSNKEIKYQIIVNVSNVENPIFFNNNYSIKNEKISMKKINLNNKKNKSKSIFDFIDLQKKLDEEITMDILSGKGFPSIEQKLSSYLKN